MSGVGQTPAQYEDGGDVKRLLNGLLLLLVLGAAAVPTAVEAAEHTARGAGRAHENGIPYAFRFRAAGSPKAATGRLVIDAGPEGVIEGTVDRLFVDGRRAILTGTVDSQLNLIPYFAIAVKDIGKDTDQPRDRILVEFSTDPIPCQNADFLASDRRIDRGDIVVN